jgi:hypothetical protein
MRAFVISLAMLGCSPPIPAPDRPEPGTAEDCRAACTRLAELDCREAKPTDAGAACETVCNNAETSGYATLNPRCVARANSCADVDQCAEE